MTDFTYITILAESCQNINIMGEMVLWIVLNLMAIPVLANYINSRELKRAIWLSDVGAACDEVVAEFEAQFVNDLTQDDILTIVMNEINWELTSMRESMWGKRIDEVVDADSEDDMDTVHDLPVWHHMPPVPAGHGAELAEYFRH